MLAGLQIHIKALNAIIPDSFIFILDSTDRTFIYKSSDCTEAMDEILRLEKEHGIENVVDNKKVYNQESMDHFCMIRQLSGHTFLGFFVLKEKISDFRINKAQEYFLLTP